MRSGAASRIAAAVRASQANIRNEAEPSARPKRKPAWPERGGRLRRITLSAIASDSLSRSCGDGRKRRQNPLLLLHCRLRQSIPANDHHAISGRASGATLVAQSRVERVPQPMPDRRCGGHASSQNAWPRYESWGVHPVPTIDLIEVGMDFSFGSVQRRYRSWANLTRVYRASAPNAAPHRACDYGEIRSPCTSSSSAAASSRSALVQSDAPPSHQSRPVRLPLLLPPTYPSPEPHARVNVPTKDRAFNRSECDCHCGSITTSDFSCTPTGPRLVALLTHPAR